VLYVCFQGTADIKDALADINIKKVNLGNKIKVHAGFYNQYKSVEQFLLDKCKDYSKVIFSGQSLGGSLAVLSVYHMKKIYATSKAIACITFACPRIGNQNFVNHYNSLLIETKQYVYKNDIVPRLPFFWMNYFNTTKQIIFGSYKWYDYLLIPFGNPLNHTPIKYMNEFKV
jgi:predicted lipase